MVSSQRLLSMIENLGVTVVADGDKLRVTFNDERKPDVEPLLAELREHKAEVLTLLTADKCRIRDRESGLARMRQACRQISDLWAVIESSGGSLAWEWILRGSAHGAKIRMAEDRVNIVGSKGNPVDPDSFVKRNFLPVVKSAGIGKLRFHDLRYVLSFIMFSVFLPSL